MRAWASPHFLGFLAFWRGHEMRLAAVLAIVLLLWGAAVGHAIDMVRSNNFAPGNAGVIFWTDVLLPVFGLALVAVRRQAADEPSLPAEASALSTRGYESLHRPTRMRMT